MKTNSHEEGLRGRGAARSKNQQPSVDGWGARLAGPTVRTSKARLAPGWCPGPPPHSGSSGRSASAPRL